MENGGLPELSSEIMHLLVRVKWGNTLSTLSKRHGRFLQTAARGRQLSFWLKILFMRTND